MVNVQSIGARPCPACDFERARVQEGGRGTLSIVCPECGATTFVKSPRAVAALNAKLGRGAREEPKPAAPAKPAAPVKAADWFESL